MTAQVPEIDVYELNSPIPSTGKPGMAGKIAVIGAFNTDETNPQLFIKLDDAKTAFGSDTTFNGCAVLDDLFKGASSLLCVNTTTWSSATPPVADKTMTTTKLTNALAKIKGEDFDILFVAETLTADYQSIITAFLDEKEQMKLSAGYIAGIAGANASANLALASNAGKHCYGLILQSGTYDGTDKNLLLSSARYAGIIAGLNVGNTMTMKTVPYLTAVNPELNFETGGDGKSYVEAGITCFRCLNRNTGKYLVVNSEQPNGLDLYINRVRDYVIKEMALHQFLGDRNRKATHEAIMQELARVKAKCVNSLDLLEDIQYHVVKNSSSCVDIYLDKLLFAGIITQINVYYTVEVE